jgi:Tol biopolymer transport system component
LKVMAAEAAGLASANNKFVREAQAASALNHPNIVTVHEVITWNSVPVIVMELVEGQPLRALCGQLMPLEQAKRIGTQILEALQFAHAHGIVHRDLKPENVMVRPDGYTKVLDFGLARRSFLDKDSAETSSNTGMPVGTLRYMSPEQCRGEAATAASDVFAAGIMLYEMFAGRHPFEKDSPLDTAHAIARERPKAPSHWNRKIPGGLEQLILLTLEKEPAQRPTAQHMAHSLAAGLGSQAPNARLRRMLLAVVAGLLSVILASALWWTRGRLQMPLMNDSTEANLQIVPVTGWSGTERMPSLSPDGSKVAYEFTNAGSTVSHIYLKDLALKDLAAATPVPLTDGPMSDVKPVFSPDGNRIAFLRRTKRKQRVMIIPASGGLETQVGEASEVSPSFQVMAWDPAGQMLIVSDSVGNAPEQVALFAIPLKGGERRQLTFPKLQELDCMPLLSPDGKKLGFARVDPWLDGRIWALPMKQVSVGAAGSIAPQPLTTNDQPIASWGWLHNGKDLLISRQNGVRATLWTQPVGAGTARQVTWFDDQVAQLSLARRGKQLVYTPLERQRTSIWQFSTSQPAVEPRAVIASGFGDVDVRYSPDGQMIAFASTRSGEMNIWVCARDGSKPRKMTFYEDGHRWAAGSPNWSPDGRFLAYDAGGANENGKIFVLDVATGKSRRVTGPAAWIDSVPSWSADGRSIYFNSNRGGHQDIWSVPAAGGEPVQVTRHTGFECAATPDGRFIYYTRYFTPGIWRVSLVSGEDQLVPGMEEVNTRCWQGTPKGIYYVTTDGSAALKFFDYATGKVRFIRSMPRQPVPTYRGLSVSPDGQTVLYAQSEESGSNLMLVKNFH